MRFSGMVARFLARSRFEQAYILTGLFARLKSIIFYKSQFGSFGGGSWLKRPRQVISPRNIHIGKNVRIEGDAILYSVGKYGPTVYDGKVTIGDGVYMNHSCNITCAVEVRVGDEVAFGPNVFVCDFDHGYQDPNVGMIDSPLSIKGPVIIGDRSWIGANVYIGSGVELGEHCTVAANSVVTKSFPSNCIIAGVPAKLIKVFDNKTQTWQRPL